MKVLLTAIGSPGDVNPFIALGCALRARGHQATLVVDPHFRQQVAAAGLEFAALGNKSPLLGRSRKHTCLMLHPQLGHRHLWRELVLPSVPLLVETLEKIVRSRRPDVVVYHPVSFGARWVCSRYGIPSALGALSPLVWMSSKDGSVHARSLMREPPPEWLLRCLLAVARPLSWWTVDRALNPIRKRYGFSPARDILFDHLCCSEVSLGLWSSAFRGSMPDDPPNARICGFPWFDRGHHVELASERLAGFMDAGPPPIIFSMGTTVAAAVGDFYEYAAEACRRLGRRGLLLTGSLRNPPRRLPPGVRAFQYAPFSAVLPRGCLTVHHGGIGTTAQALRAGRPTVIIPMAFDQFDNAARAKRLGVSVTLGRQCLTPTNLTNTLRRVLSSPEMLLHARRLAESVSREDGAVRAVGELERFADGYQATAGARERQPAVRLG